MPVKLTTNIPKEECNMNQLTDGELAIVIEGSYKNVIFQAIRLNGDEWQFQPIGCGRGKAWDKKCTLRVRRLKAGEVLEIT